MRAHVVTIVCKFGSDRAIFGVVGAIPAKKFTDTQTDDRRRAIALAHSLNELKMHTVKRNCHDGHDQIQVYFTAEIYELK